MPEKDKSTAALPERVKENLPQHAQEIYLKAHNSALEQYKDPSKRRGNESLEEVAHKVAWSAVEQEYHKDENGNWVKKKGK
jgi:cation transport regulator